MFQTNPSFTLNLLQKMASAAEIKFITQTHLNIHHIAIIQALVQTGKFKDDDFIFSCPAPEENSSINIPAIDAENFNTPSWQRAAYPNPIPLALLKLAELKHRNTPMRYQSYQMALSQTVSADLKQILMTEIEKGNNLKSLVDIMHPMHTPSDVLIAKLICDQPLSELYFIKNCQQYLWQLHQCIFFSTQQQMPFPAQIIDPTILSTKGKETIKKWHCTPMPSYSATPYSHPESGPANVILNPQPQTLSPSALLTYQDCSFLFYCKHILKINPAQTDESEYFKQFGHLLHEIWAEHPMSSTDEMTEIIKHHPYFQNLQPHLISAMSLHIQKINQEWHIKDSQRPPYKIIGKEQVVSYSHANLTLAGRIDRIDEIAPNTHIIIDYKTSKPSLNWYQNIIEQLPIYAVMYGKTTKGLAYAQLKKNQCELSGHIHEDLMHSPLTPINQLNKRYEVSSWDQAWNQWQKQLHHLIERIMANPITANPQSHRCNDCQFKPICRSHLEEA